jgi:hypothetical protein
MAYLSLMRMDPGGCPAGKRSDGIFSPTQRLPAWPIQSSSNSWEGRPAVHSNQVKMVILFIFWEMPKTDPRFLKEIGGLIFAIIK